MCYNVLYLFIMCYNALERGFIESVAVKTYLTLFVFVCCTVTLCPGGGAGEQPTLRLPQRLGGEVAALCCTGNTEIHMRRNEARNHRELSSMLGVNKS